MSELDAVLASFTLLLVELVLLFVVVAFAVALAARRVGVARLRRWMGGSRLSAALKGIGLGFVTPFCTYSAIPVLSGMIHGGARTSAWAGFVLAAPVLDPLIAGAIAVIFSPQAAAAYVAATFAAVLVAALAADLFGLQRFVSRNPVAAAQTTAGGRRGAAEAGIGPGVEAASGMDSCDVPDPFTTPRPWRGWRDEAEDAGRYAVDLVRGMAVPLVAAVAVAAVIAGVVPRNLIASLAGPGNPLAVPTAALIGAPFYVSGEAFLPIAAALSERGMSTGAVYALIISGAGVNIPEFALLGRLFDGKLLAALVVAVFLIAAAVGLVIPAVAPA